MIDGFNLPFVPTASADEWATVLIFGTFFVGLITAGVRVIVAAVGIAAKEYNDANAVAAFFAAVIAGSLCVGAFVWVYLIILGQFLPGH